MKSCAIATLALKDVLHEWRMSLCVMFAVAAIATPLLLFFGLKSGVMQTLESRLLANPASREIISLSEGRFEDKWFSAQRADPKVAFVIPRTRRLAASAEFRALKPGSKTFTSLDLYPSGPEDPQLLHYQRQVPEPEQCVLTAEASRRLGAGAGAQLEAVISRERGKVKVSRIFTVAGVLPDAAGTVAAAYVTLPELEEIEAFKDGFGVAQRNWPGAEHTAYPVTPQVLVVLPQWLDAVREALLIQNTGFVKLHRLAQDELSALFPELAGQWCAYQLSTVGNPASLSDLLALSDRLRGRTDVLIIPQNEELSLTIGTQRFKVRTLKAFRGVLNQSLQARDSSEFSAAPAPREIFLSKTYARTLSSDPVTLTASYAKRTAEGELISRQVNFEAQLNFIDGIAEDTALLPEGLMAQLSLLAVRELNDEVNRDGLRVFTLKRRGYTGFRLYAKTLTDVVALQEQLREQGIKTSSRADRISEVLSLDKYLSLLFMLIATASLLGATCCLIANVYANVERKRRELAILRLLGVNRVQLNVFPLTGSLLLTLGGMLCSLMLFTLLSLIINSMFSYQLQGDEQFCTLSLAQTLGAILIAAGIAGLSGLMSSRRVMSIEPSESLRDE